MSWVEFQLHYDVPECVSQLLSLVFVVILTQVKNQGLSNSINLNPSGIPKGSVFCSSFGVDTFRRFELTKSVNASEAEQHIYIGLFIFFPGELSGWMCLWAPKSLELRFPANAVYVQSKGNRHKATVDDFLLAVSTGKNICEVGNLTVKQCHSYIVIRHMIEKHWKDLDVWLPRQLQHLRTS